MARPIVPFSKETVDPLFKRFVQFTNKEITEKNDDIVVLCIGETGTGKSMLGLHAAEIIDPHMSIDLLGFNPPTFVRAMQKVIEQERGRRFLPYDEGFLSRRNWASQWNKDIIKTYKEIRGQNIYHWLCTPTAHDIDKDLIQRVDYLIYIINKDTKRPRLYVLFENRETRMLGNQPKYVLDRIREEFGDLSFASLQKAMRRDWHCWTGWFRDYKGALRAPYDALKEDKGIESIKELASKWGNKDYIPESVAASTLCIAPQTLRKNIHKFVKDGSLNFHDHIVVDVLGRYKVTKSGLEKLKDLVASNTRGVVKFGLSPAPNNLFADSEKQVQTGSGI